MGGGGGWQEVAEYVGLLLLEREYCSLTTILSKICVLSFIYSCFMTKRISRAIAG